MRLELQTVQGNRERMDGGYGRSYFFLLTMIETLRITCRTHTRVSWLFMAIPQVGLPEAWPRRGSHLILEAQRLGF